MIFEGVAGVCCVLLCDGICDLVTICRSFDFAQDDNAPTYSRTIFSETDF
jgi:hypothetical protein